jgi:tetratricopeptide (TPR) repeat protein/transcriptional regulator with XRE-family HTH domain
VFGELVRAQRRRLGLTQEELADRAGLGIRSIRRIESGRILAPRPPTVRMLADAFGLSGANRERFCTAAAPEPGSQPPTGTTAPAQLPPDVHWFIGRDEPLARLGAVLAEADQSARTAAVIFVISGAAGVGKTALAVHWGHQVRSAFPDGQLFVNLRGYDPDLPMRPEDALAATLRALGVPEREIPLGVDDRAAWYRTLLADRRMLVVLDNAASVEQVRPLLPGVASSVVVVTSRDTLGGLVARDGASRVDLDLLPVHEANTLLRHLIGSRVDAEPDASERLAELCARLPLALRVAAELAATRPNLPVADLVADLTDHSRRLALLHAGDDQHSAVSSVFSWSLRHLPPAATRTFELLGSHPGPDFDGYAAAALTDVGLHEAESTLELLVRAHLVHETRPGRCAMHDLLRAYAVSRASADANDVRAALERLWAYALATAAAAMNTLHPAEVHRRPAVPPASTPVPDMSTANAAVRWLEAELPFMVAMAEHTAAHGWPDQTIALSVTLYRYLDSSSGTDALAIHGSARRAAGQLGDLAAEGEALLGLGSAHMWMGQMAPAVEHLTRAAALFRSRGEPTGEARALLSLSVIEQMAGSYQAAIENIERVLSLFEAADDLTGQANALINLGIAEERLGRYEAATRCQWRALELQRRLGNIRGQASALNNLGSIEQRTGRYDAAREHYEAALVLFDEVGSARGGAHVLDNLGVVHTRLGRTVEAAEFHRSALGIFREIGDRDGESSALNGLGEASSAAGHTDEARTHHLAALSIATRADIHDQVQRARAALAHGPPDQP